jgi:3'-phosphoadenosine 5'-phosphosulfate sulfotransferase (PAPS reductase)/FAD synthetase
VPFDPFKIEGPAYVSFSGGRTSGYMLRRCLDASDGQLPPGVHIVFANTGREMPATLDFVRDVAEQWCVPIAWVEYRLNAWDEPIYQIVDYASASRSGEPFALYLDHVERMTASKGREPYLPTPGNRFCTTELKIRVMKKWMLDRGYEHWTNIVGLRFDEPSRWRKIDRTCPKERWEIELPLVDAKVDVGEVKRFWSQQPFDLGIKGDYEGNCDACHLKRPWKVAQVFKDYPERAAWWAERETRVGKQFRPSGPSIKRLVEMSKLPIVRDDEHEIQCVGCTD